MAAVADLLGRAADLGAHIVYQGAPPRWLELAAQKARDGVPVIVNVKGIRPDAVPVLLTLAEYERLTRAAAGGGGAQSLGRADLRTDGVAHRAPSGENAILCDGGAL